MPDPKLRTIVDAHKPKAFYKPTRIKQFGERELLRLEDAEIYVRHFEWIISSAGVDFDDEYMDPETTLPQFAIDAANGVPIQINHDYQPLNCGRSTDGYFDSEKEIVTASGYIQEGLTDVDSDSVIARLIAGTTPGCSVGYRGETVCNYDNTPMHWLFGDCQYGHTRGQEIQLDADGNETKDVKEAVETFTILGKITNGKLLEFSPVWRACNQDAQLIRSVRSLYKSGKIGDTEINSLTDRMRYDFKSILSSKRSLSLPQKRRKKVANPKDEVTIEEYNEVVDDLQEARDTIKELEKRPTVEEVDEKIDALSTELEGKDAEIIELKEKAETAQEISDEYDLGLKQLRKDVLDEYAREQGLSRYGRENDEAYNDVKKSVDTIESIGALIRRRKRYSSGSADQNGGKTTRRSHVVDLDENAEKNHVPVPGTPGAGAYRE